MTKKYTPLLWIVFKMSIVLLLMFPILVLGLRWVQSKINSKTSKMHYKETKCASCEE